MANATCIPGHLLERNGGRGQPDWKLIMLHCDGGANQ